MEFSPLTYATAFASQPSRLPKEKTSHATSEEKRTPDNQTAETGISRIEGNASWGQPRWLRLF